MKRKTRIAVFSMMMMFTVMICWAQDEETRRPDVQLPVTTFSSPAIGSGARAMGMGGAFIAIADDASAALWNPAGVAQLQKLEMSVSWQAWNTFSTDVPASIVINESQAFTLSPVSVTQEGTEIDFISVLYPFTKNGWQIVPQISYRRAINAGLDRDSTTALYENVQGDRGGLTSYSDNDGGYDILALTVGVGYGKFFGGASLNLWRNGFEGTDTSEEIWDWEGGFGTLEETFTYSADASGLNATLGFLYKPKDRLNLGAVFRTPFTLESEVSETLRGRWDEMFLGHAFSEEWTDEANGTVEVEWPWSIGAGVAVRPTNHFKLAFDYTLSNWSDAEVTETMEEEDTMFVRPYPIRFTREQKDSDQFRTGFEYLFVSHGVLLPLRAGAFVERQLFLDARGDRIVYKGLSLGGGVGYRRFMFDIAGVYQFGDYARGGAVANEDFSSFRLLVTGVVRK